MERKTGLNFLENKLTHPKKHLSDTLTNLVRSWKRDQRPVEDSKIRCALYGVLYIKSEQECEKTETYDRFSEYLEINGFKLNGKIWEYNIPENKEYSIQLTK